MVDDRASAVLVGDINSAVELDPATLASRLKVWQFCQTFCHTTRPIPRSLRGSRGGKFSTPLFRHHPPHPATAAPASHFRSAIYAVEIAGCERWQRKAGEMLAEMENRGRPEKGNTMLPLLSDLGITKMQSSRWGLINASWATTRVPWATILCHTIRPPSRSRCKASKVQTETCLTSHTSRTFPRPLRGHPISDRQFTRSKSRFASGGSGRRARCWRKWKTEGDRKKVTRCYLYCPT